MNANLPTWADMTDLDKGAALLHLHKCRHEGAAYAQEHYPATYFDHPELLELDDEQASEHAAGLDDAAEELSYEDYGRLYDAALAADEARRVL